MVVGVQLVVKRKKLPMQQGWNRCKIALFWLLMLAGLAKGFSWQSPQWQSGKVLPKLSTKKALTQFILDSWDTEKDLPSNAVMDMALGVNGYLWLATYDGLARFDGQQVQSYSRQNYPDAFETSGLISVLQGKDGTLWLGTNGGGLIAYRNDTFTKIPGDSTAARAVITDLVEDNEGTVWVSMRNGLAQVVNGQLENLDHEYLNGQNIYEMMVCRNGRVLMATLGSGVLQYYKGEWTANVFANLPSQGVRTLYEDRLGRIWIGTDGGLAMYNKEGKLAEVYTVATGLISNYVNAIIEDMYGNIWLGTDNGLMRLGLNGLDYLQEAQGLADNTIESLTADTQGNLWVGTKSGGLVRLKDGKFLTYSTAEGLPNETVNVIYAEGGNTWIGTDNGLAQLQDDGIRAFRLNGSPSQNVVRDAYRDREGTLWLATYGGLLTFEQGQVVQKITTANGLPNNRVRRVLGDTAGNLWIGTVRGLVKRLPDGTIVPVSGNKGLENAFIMALKFDSRGRLWVGTNSTGVYCIDGQEVRGYSSAQGLGADVVFSLYEDKWGTFWVGTTVGLSRFDGNRFSNLTARQGLPVNSVFQVLEDNLDNFWLTSDKGLVRVPRKAVEDVVLGRETTLKNFAVFNKSDGLVSNSATGASISAKDTGGNLWIAMNKGVSMVDPENIPLSVVPPRVVIERVDFDDSTYLAKAVPPVPPGNRRVRIYFTGIDFYDPGGVDFKIKLDGFDKDWVNIGHRRVAYYTNLSPGAYTFRVMARNSDGIISVDEGQLELYQEAFFYQTNTFYIIVGFFVLALALGGWFGRIKILQNRNLALQKLVDVRTAAIQRQKETLQDQTQELDTFDKIVQVINRQIEYDALLKVMLEQAFGLFGHVKKIAFVVYNRNKDRWYVAEQQGYAPENDPKTISMPNHLVREWIASRLEKIDEGLFLFYPPVEYAPELYFVPEHPCVVMSVEYKGFEEGYLLMDAAATQHGFGNQEIQRLKRFREHAMSAYSKARNLQKVALQNREMERYYLKMSESIRYARQIQDALMPRTEQVQKLAPECFIFYQPKDVVSGDFYWMVQKEHKVLLAVVDCTGHGVPGAFMSVLGNSLLNQIVAEQGHTDPDVILNELNRLTRDILHRHDYATGSGDGMDMALCVFDTQKNELAFAGAKRSLVFVRQGKMEEIKAARVSIGELMLDDFNPFKKTVLPLNEVDMLYMYTDGYSDQFGGTNKQKFMVRRFKDLLLKIHDQPVMEQKNVLNQTLQDWQGGEEQVDDMLVVGLRVNSLRTQN